MEPFVFPNIDPVVLQIGPLAIRWYALAYIAGLVAGWRYCLYLAARSPQKIPPRAIDDFLVWATLAVVVGGRLGFVLFYQPGFYMENPLEIVKVWRGGMSFHGGLLGVIIAVIMFARAKGIKVMALADIVGAASPIGLFFGRIANFINAELWGRVTDVPWGVVFPTGGPMPRHPSQLYEAILEGLVLFLVLFYAVHRRNSLQQPGVTTAIFMLGYGIARIFVELFREPDAHIGLLTLGTTWGQWLSVPVILFGIYLLWRRRPNNVGSAKQS